MMTNIRKSQMHSIIDLENMRTVYNKTVDYYDFGKIENTFDIRNIINYTNENGTLAIFSMYGIYQIARTFPIDCTNQMNIIMPLFIQNALNVPAFTASLTLFPAILCSCITAPIAGRIYDKHGCKKIVPIGFLLILVFIILLGLTGNVNSLLLIVICETSAK